MATDLCYKQDWGGPPERRRAGRRDSMRSILCAFAIVMSSVPGCHRSMYRERADSQAYCLIDEKTDPECWPLPDFTIQTDPASRMYDPFDPDFPPMPPDDPTSHEWMHHINCQEGYGCWHANGDTRHVANPIWLETLPRTDTGAVAIDSQSAIQLALTHSPDYQREFEELYLSALDVSFQRFQFDVQYFAGFSSFFTFDGRDRDGVGGESSSQFELNTFSEQGGNRLLRRKMTASGAQLAVGFANSLIWEFSGNNVHSASSLIDFSLIQPLLRGAGRDVVLEDLTQSERTLLANVRQLERFRREFYVEIITGRSASGGVSRGGLSIDNLSGRTDTSGSAGGLLGLLQSQQDIRNQRSNVAALQSSVAQLEAFFLAGRIDYFQVEFARQALYNAQSRLLSSERNLQASLDQFKLDLGLPPGLTLAVSETMIEPFQLVDPRIVPLQDRLTRLQVSVGETLSRLYDQVELPEAPTRGPGGDLPGRPGRQGANPAGADPAEVVQPAGPEAPGENLAAGAPRDRIQRIEQPARLEWNANVATAMQSLKRDVKAARQSIEQATRRHSEFARQDIRQLRQSMPRRNQDAAKLKLQIIERMRQHQAEDRMRHPETGNDEAADDEASDDEAADGEASDNPFADEPDDDLFLEIADEDVRSLLPFRADRLEQLPGVLDSAVSDILSELERIDSAFQKSESLIDEILANGERMAPPALFMKLQDDIFVQLPSQMNQLAASVLSITLAQARARTESVSLPSVSLDWENAVSLARCNRLDWMNARAALVDSWRQVQVTANDLESQLDVILTGDIGNVGDNGLDFRSSTGRLRFGIEFDSPITRLAERNTYRESLVRYQQSRRGYYQFEDQVATSLRDILRRLVINQINFELQRAAIDVAISQVELARLRLQEPPRPGEQSTFGATTARDLVTALSGLLSAQNDFLSVWINQESLRRSLDLDLGTMQLDGNGLWIDPGERLGLTPDVDPFASPATPSVERNNLDDPQIQDPPVDPGTEPARILAPEELPITDPAQPLPLSLPGQDDGAQSQPFSGTQITHQLMQSDPVLLPLPQTTPRTIVPERLPEFLRTRTIQTVTYEEPILDADEQPAQSIPVKLFQLDGNGPMVGEPVLGKRPPEDPIGTP